MRFIKSNKILQKISLENPELYFNSLIQTYFDFIKKADKKRLDDIAGNTFLVYELINKYLNKIENKENFSDLEIKLINDDNIDENNRKTHNTKHRSKRF